MQNQTDGFVIFIFMFSQVYSVITYIPAKLISLITWAFTKPEENPIRPPGFPEWYTYATSSIPHKITIIPKQEIIDYFEQEAGDFDYTIYFNNKEYIYPFGLSKYALNVELCDYDLKLISKFLMNYFLKVYNKIGFENIWPQIIRGWGLFFKGFILPYCLRFDAPKHTTEAVKEFVEFTYDRWLLFFNYPELQARIDKNERKILYDSSKYDYRNRNFPLKNIKKYGSIIIRKSAITDDFYHLSFEDIARHAVKNWDK